MVSQRAYSITTRIKTAPALSWHVARLLREHIPLQQGLRPARTGWLMVSPPLTQRAYSITTRIKTCDFCFKGYFVFLREHIPLQQGLRR